MPTLSPCVSSSGEGRDHEAEGLGEGDGSILGWRKVEAVGEIGQDRAEHGGDHSVDEDGEYGGEDEHAEVFLS